MTNQLYVVEDNIEMNPRSREVNAARVLFCSMKPGQSFLCTQKDLRAIYKWCQKKRGYKCTGKEIGEGIFRVWRVA